MAQKKVLTARAIEAMRPAPAGKRTIVWDGVVPSFGVRVTDKGRRTFVLVTRYPGAKHPSPREIGAYGEISLEDARAKARRWLEQISQGIDPAFREQAAAREQVKRQADTFSAAFDAYADDHLSTLRTGSVVAGVVRRVVYPKFGPLPLSEIKRGHVVELVRGLRKETPTNANRVLAYLKTFFAWAVELGSLESSPAIGVKRPTKEIKRDRVLADAEIRAVWSACGRLGVFGQAIRLLLATGQRRSEVGELPWAEINGSEKLWRLPAKRTKAARDHVVPLSDLALSIIEEMPHQCAFVFSTNGRSPIAGWSKAKLALDAELKRMAGAGEGPEVPEWHLHDLRRSAATNMAKHGVDRIVIAKLLNHAEIGVTSVYDRHLYDNEKRHAMNVWAERLAQIVSSRPAAVVPIRGSM